MNDLPGTAYADDLRIGHRYQLGSHAVTEPELVDFARQWDPQGFHVDKEIADGGAYGGLIASGIHTIAIYQRLAVEAAFSRWNVVAGRRLGDVRFLRPVRAGDTLSGAMTIDDIIFDDRRRALVTLTAEVVNQHEAAVLSAAVEVFVHARS